MSGVDAAARRGGSHDTRGWRPRGWIAAGAAIALVATIAVIASGYDARETPRAEPGVWVARDAGQYARVNTDTGELDIVRKVAEPSSVVQTSGSGVVFSNGNGRAWPIDAANPTDFAEEPEPGDEGAGGEAEESDDVATAAGEAATGENAAVRMPDGTREVVASGRFVALRTEGGAVYAGELAGDASALADATGQPAEDLASRLTSLRQIDPLAEENQGDDGADTVQDEQTTYQAEAIALSDDGMLALFSATEGAVHRFDILTGEFVGTDAVPEGVEGASDAQLALVSGAWVLLDAESGQLWREGGDSWELELEGSAHLQASGSSGAGDAISIADASGLWSVPLSGAPERVVDADGVPAQPIEVAGTLYAAWLNQNGGSLWNGDEVVSLQVDDSVSTSSDLSPVFRSNGERAVLTEVTTGMLWTLPDGELIPISQWSISDPPKENQGTVVVEEVTEQVPPVAVDDAFGVRAGEPAPLPVMLNDFDANKRDVLTIVPESLSDSPLPETFGTLQLLPDGQSLTVQPAEGASGTASFRYRVTDGTLTSEAATVTLTVVDESVNTAPEWCPVEGCQREWGVPSVAPGGTLVYPLLEGWVDPEGDVMMLVSAETVRAEDPVHAIVTADGRLAVRHTDANVGSSEVLLRVTVQDSRGEERQRELQVSVQPDASPEFAATAANVQAGEAVSLSPLSRVAGGSGSYELVDATAQGSEGQLRVTAKPASGTVEVEASAAGTTTVAVNVRDTVTGNETTGQLRVTASTAGPGLAIPPLRAFVRPLSDSTVNVLDAIPGADSRSLSVVAAEVADGELRADVIQHEQVRVAGGTADGAPGRVGAVDLTVAEGGAEARGRLTVFQVPEASGSSAIAVADTATVRAGSIVDIRVLENDVAAPGERLLLHPEVTGSGTKGELAFASGSTLRYLAPAEPGTYRLSYTTYGASTPEASDVGTVLVKVIAEGSNRDPQPRTVTARIAPGEATEVQVPLSGVDPDGDRVRLTSVSSPDDSQVTATLAPAGSVISVAASEQASAGMQIVEYTVRDGFGGSAAGRLRIIVTAAESGQGAPIAVTDHARLVPSAEDPLVVRPLENDIDPARGTLKLVSVEPNVAGGAESAEYRRLAERLDLSQLKQGRIAVSSDDQIGTVSYRYTVESDATSSTADGLIVVQTSERVGSQAPTVTDTVLNVRDRSLLSGEGVNVISDKVRWATGDASSLELSLWGNSATKYKVRGDKITGTYDPDGDVVVFRLAGTDSVGSEVSTYGFLIIPPLDELRLTLKAGLKPLEVDEDKSVDARVQDIVDLGSNDRVELRDGDFRTGRSQASCAATTSDTLRYSAGKEAPWVDSCVIAVRLVGQKTWTLLAVPITIAPRQPVAQLTSLTRTISPGGSETIRLADMVSWQGNRAGEVSDLRFEVSGGGSLFDVKTSGSSVSVSARADAVPGSQEVLSVSVAGAGQSRAPLTLRVGEAPRDLPRGGTVALQCNVGAACTASVIGVSGEHDPFAGKNGGGLKLESVSSGSCQAGSFTRVGDTSVSVSWPAGRVVGGTCTVGFTVRDAQGRSGEGSIEFDARGLPEAPASISQTAFTGTSATFSVTLASQQAHPEVTGVTLSGGGSSSCAATGPGSYQCVVTGLSNGEKHSFAARAVNAVGESAPSSAVTAWAYQAPSEPKVTVTSIADSGNTDQTKGGVRLNVTGSSDVSSFQVALNGADVGTLSGPSGTRDFTGLDVGPKTFRVTPVTAFEVPEIGGASATGATAQADGYAIGAPLLSGATLTSAGGSTTGIVTPHGQGAHNGESVTYRYTISAPWGQPASCSDGGQSSATFEGLHRYWRYTAMACASSDYGVSTATTEGTSIGGAIPRPGGLLAYGVGPGATVNETATAASYPLTTAPSPVAVDGATIQYRIGGTVTGAFALDSAVAHIIEVRQCFDAANEATCSEWVQMSSSGAPTTVEVAVPSSPAVCYSGANPPANQDELKELLNISGAAKPHATVTAGTPGEGTIPLRVTWTGPFAGLHAVDLKTCYTP